MDANDREVKNAAGISTVGLIICCSKEVFHVEVISGVTGMRLGFPIFVTVLFWVLGALMFPVNPEELSLTSKNDGKSSRLVRTSGVSMRVLWTISGYKVGEGAVWGDEQARKLLFKPLDVDATEITFNGRTCHDIIFEKKIVNAKEYLANAYRTTPQALKIDEEFVEVIKTNCSLPGFAEYIRLKDRRLIIHLNGVFFYFEPAMNY
jgi:hypothetical protein